MDKPKKLKRYNRKDYTQLVDFPVEIVGRDGVVRHYTFEASVRLYQRRIASAASRYEDLDLADAEVQHCQRRIDQLRKSYFQRYGWAAIRDARGQPVLTGPLAGEVAAFLRRFFGDSVPPESLSMALVADAPEGQTLFLRVVNSDTRYLLYLFRFEAAGSCGAREAFFALLRTLKPLHGDQVESLLAFHHTADCGLILTGTGEPGATRRRWEDHEAEADAEEARLLAMDGEGPPDAYPEGVRLLADGEPEVALQRFEEGLAQPPFRRPLALAAAIVADLLGQPARSEFAALMGVHYLPEDPVFRYHLGLSLVRQRRLDEARAPLERALAQAPQLFPVVYLCALLALRSGEHNRAEELLQRAWGLQRPDDHELRLGMRAALGALRSRSALSGAGTALALVGTALWPVVGWSGAVVLALGLCTLSLRAGVAAVLAGVSSDRRLRGLPLAPPELLGGGGPRLDEFLV